MPEPSFLGDADDPRRSDTKWLRWTKMLGQYQNRSGALVANNPRRSDGIRVVKQKLLHAINDSSYNSEGSNPSGGGSPHTPPASPLFGPETFETPGTGYVLAGWSEFPGGAGIINPAYTGVVLDGSQCLRIVTSSGAACWIQRSVSAIGNIFIYGMLRIVATAGDKSFLEVQSIASTVLARVRLQAGDFEVSAGAASALLATSPNLNTLYHFWFEYNKNNGSNRIANFGFSTDGIRPTSGGNYGAVATTTSATDVQIVAFGVPGTDFGSDVEYLFDYLLADDVQIGNNP
jgi:hypothetical protein